MAARRAEADEFYAELTPREATADEAMVMRQAFAGLLWSKQLYYYDVGRWLDGDPGEPTPPEQRLTGRNTRWRSFDAFDIMSMPDKWEYPWFAAWDLAFHCVALAHVDPAFAKYQLILLCREWFQNPNGALPAYEWDFSDVNPPVQAWAALEVFAVDEGRDLDFLSRVFDKLMINFTWWVNLEDPGGRNVFEGGFLGLDNIGPLDRSHLPVGGILEQSDATGWMGAYAIALGTIATVLSQTRQRPASDLVLKFVEHFAGIRDALTSQGLWDETDGMYYDRLVTPSGTQVPIKVRSMVGMIPALAAAVIHEEDVQRALVVDKHFASLLGRECLSNPEALREQGLMIGLPGEQKLLLSLVGQDRLPRLLSRLFDESEFLSPHGLRALSAYHRDHPYQISVEGIDGQHRLRARRVHRALVRRELQLARPGLVPAELPGDHRARALPPVPGRRVHHRVPHRVRQPADPGQDRRRPAGPADLPVHPRSRAAGAHASARTTCCRTIPPGGTTWSSASTSTATTAPRSAPRTRPAGPA